MTYERFLSEIKGPRTLSAEFYDVLMPVYGHLNQLRNHEVNFNELIAELINFVMEDRAAMVGLEYYCDYIQESLADSLDPNDRHDAAVYIPAVEYLGKAIYHFFHKLGLYENGVANYRLKSWLSPTMLAFEKYMAFDCEPNQPIGTGLIELPHKQAKHYPAKRPVLIQRRRILLGPVKRTS